jgi:hypothetical protein
MLLSASSHKYIYQQLNTDMWPFRYADIRRLTDFQNRVFRAYAERRHIPFLDVAGQIPQDPALFSDTVHMTEVGERLKAWIVVQQLIPYLRPRIESGQLPHAHPKQLSPPPNLEGAEMKVCSPR